MNGTLTGTALTLHNLGIAAGFGGTLFGQTALHPAVRAINDKRERGLLLHDSWKRFNPAQAVSIGIVGLTWLVGRTALSGGEIDERAHKLVVAKDVLVGLYTATGIASMAVGMSVGKNAPPVEAGGIPAPETSERDAKALRTVDLLGKVNIAAAAGIIALTAILNFKAGQSNKWALLAKILP